MKRNFFIAGFIAFGSLLLVSCSKDNGSATNNPGGGGGTIAPGPLFLSVRTVVQTNCALSGCHTGANPAGDHNFSSDNTIVAQKLRIKVRAVDQAGTATQMPPPPRAPLSAADQKKITDWIAAGGVITN